MRCRLEAELEEARKQHEEQMERELQRQRNQAEQELQRNKQQADLKLSLQKHVYEDRLADLQQQLVWTLWEEYFDALNSTLG